MKRILMGSLALVVASSAQAEEKPAYWELGLGLTGISFPDYLGSDERNNLVLPFPYVVYRSDRVEIDRDAFSGELFDSERWELDLSLSGSIPVKSEDNDARSGMPDLDPILQVGPVLKYELFRPASNIGRFLLELPIRAAIASDFSHVDHVGWISNPNLRYEREWFSGDSRRKIDATLGPIFGSQSYHDYFYGVDPEFARPDRPAFDADGGYGGWRVSAGFSHRIRNFWYGGFVRYFDLAGAEYADSPLVKSDHGVIAGAAVAWIFSRSDNPER